MGLNSIIVFCQVDVGEKHFFENFLKYQVISLDSNDKQSQKLLAQ